MTISKLERGAQEPAWPLVLALTKALGVEVTAFVVIEPVQADAEEAKKPPGKAAGRPAGKRSAAGQADGPAERRSKARRRTERVRR